MDQQPSAGAGIVGVILYLAFFIYILVAMWKLYEKAGEPGWKALIPFYNIYTLLHIAGKPGWWLVLMLIPIVNVIVLIITMAGLAQAFGKSTAFTVGLILLSPIFIGILGLGNCTYTKPTPAA